MTINERQTMISAFTTNRRGVLRPWLCFGVMALLLVSAACDFLHDDAQREAMAAARIAIPYRIVKKLEAAPER